MYRKGKATAVAIPFRRHAVSRESRRPELAKSIERTSIVSLAAVNRSSHVIHSRARCRRFSAVSGRARPVPTANIVPRCQSATSYRGGCSLRARAREFIQSAGKCDGFRMRVWEKQNVCCRMLPF